MPSQIAASQTYSTIQGNLKSINYTDHADVDQEAAPDNSLEYFSLKGASYDEFDLPEKLKSSRRATIGSKALANKPESEKYSDFYESNNEKIADLKSVSTSNKSKNKPSIASSYQVDRDFEQYNDSQKSINIEINEIEQ
jgi:hypothetical protein